MKKVLLTTIIVIGSICCISSCKEKNFDVESQAKYVTESFDGFLWKKHIPDTIKALIITEFAECETLKKNLVLQLCDNDKVITPDIAQLYVNRVKSEDNTISIDPAKSKCETEIWLVLDDSQLGKTRTFTWYFRVKENPGLVKVNDDEPDTPWINEIEITWKNKHIANSLRIATYTSLMIIIALAAAWIIIVHLLIYPKFKITQIKKIFVMVDGGRKNIAGYNPDVKGSKEIVLTSEKKKQGFFARLFLGKVTYVRVNNLPGEITLVPTRHKFQTNATFDRKMFTITTSGDMNELKTVKSLEGDYSVEFYAKRK